MKKSTLAGGLLFFCAIILLPYASYAVPSYARQVKKPCTACHTVWANLNQYGRQFKVKAYTDVHQDWEMINKDNMNLSTILPVSARVTYYPLIREDNNNPNGPMGTFTITNPVGAPLEKRGEGSTNLNQVSIFIASRVFDYAGVFTSAEADGFNGSFSVPTVKLAFQYPLGEGNTIGLVGFTGLATSADPFNSLGGRDRDLSFDAESLPWILNSGWTFNFWSGGNIGEVVHGYFLGNRLYAAVGTMRGGNAADGIANLTNDNVSDPNDLYSRIAWDQKLPNGAVTIGGLSYNGLQKITGNAPGAIIPSYDSRVGRTYADVSLEQNYGEDHLVELQGLYGGGEDKNVLNDGTGARKFNGYYVQADYYYDRTIGLIASVNNIKYKDVQVTDPQPRDKIESWLVGVNYLPWLNTKLAFQYVNTKTTFVDSAINPANRETTDKISRVVLDILF